MDSSHFLENNLLLDLGMRTDGIRVDSVVLPNWVDSYREFLEIHREALESEFVSENLHHWIDLIFGYKQRGEEAVKAKNLFLPTSYENNIDLSKVENIIEKRGLKT